MSQLNDNGNGKSSVGLDENVAGLLCYAAWFVTGIIFLVVEKESKFVKFHALQSIITFGFFTVVGWFIGIIPFIGWLIALLIWPLEVVLWILLMIKAYNKEWFKLPIIGDIVEKQMNS